MLSEHHLHFDVFDSGRTGCGADGHWGMGALFPDRSKGLLPGSGEIVGSQHRDLAFGDQVVLHVAGNTRDFR